MSRNRYCVCVSIRMRVWVRWILEYGCVCVRCLFWNTDVCVCDDVCVCVRLACVACGQGAQLLDPEVYVLVCILTNLLSLETLTHRISFFLAGAELLAQLYIR
jgi:hypothetical protein